MRSLLAFSTEVVTHAVLDKLQEGCNACVVQGVGHYSSELMTDWCIICLGEQLVPKQY